MKPEFVDNRSGNTLLEALRGHMSWLKTTYREPLELCVATGYFNPKGFALLADHLENLKGVRLLLGAEPEPPPLQKLPGPGDPRGREFEHDLLQEAIRLNYEGLLRDRDHLPFAPETRESLTCLLDFLDNHRIEVRRYSREFLHGKAFIFSGEEGTIVGSSNFTAAGLTTNLELNLGRYDPTPVRKVQEWFDDLWEQAEPFDLASVYAARYAEYDPYLIYLRVLWELYGEELEEEKGAESRIKLASFQEDGLWRARRILSEHNGVVIADGVGLGKSFIAGALMRRAIEENRQRVLLVCPAALRDGMWPRFADRFQLFFDTVSYEQLRDEEALGGDSDHLSSAPQDYAMVVVDEAQAFRNPNTQRAEALRRLLRGTPPKNLVLLTATPVNNTLWDLYYLLTLFVGHDAAFAHRGIPSLRERFREAVNEDPYELNPDILFDVLDSVAVRRTRHFVKEYYPDAEITLPDGEIRRIRFPRPHVDALTYDLDEVLPDFFDDFGEALAPELGDPELTMTRYCPTAHLRGGAPEESQLALVGLVRSGLLKRFESSVHAFARTAERMARSHDAFLESLAQGYIITPQALSEWKNVDSEEEWKELLVDSDAESADRYEVDALRQEVTADRDMLRHFAQRASAVSPQDCPKLHRLAKTLAEISRQAREEGRDQADIRQRRKVLIFSYYSDTAEWIYEYLQDRIKVDPDLADYRGRLVSVAGEESSHGVSRERAIYGFVPESSEAPGGKDDDLYDIMVSTDVLAEGVNLQQCRNIINYDLPWNPMRLVQRHGRVDRIGSPHDDVYLKCFFPDKRLDKLLDLESRVRQKLAKAAASVGVSQEVIPGGATNEVVFAETREEIEKLRRENPEMFEQGGAKSGAHSGEEYRQELRKALQSREEEIKNLPWAAGSGVAGGPESGHFFCARVGEETFLRFVPLGADTDGVVANTLKCLRAIACERETERHLPQDLAERTYEAWEVARKNIYESWMFQSDPANLQPRVRPFFRRSAKYLEDHPPPDIDQETVDRAHDALAAPWEVRIENLLKDEIDLDSDDPESTSRALIEMVDELGLEPYEPPEPLPVIEEEDVQLICWMAVAGTDGQPIARK